MERFYRWLLGHRAAVLALFVVVSLLAAWSTRRAVVASSLGRLFLGESPAYARYIERARRFSTDDAMLVAWQGDVLTAPALERLALAVETIRTLPTIGHVTSVLDADAIQGVSEPGPDGEPVRSLGVQAWVDVACPETHLPDTCAAPEEPWTAEGPLADALRERGLDPAAATVAGRVRVARKRAALGVVVAGGAGDVAAGGASDDAGFGEDAGFDDDPGSDPDTASPHAAGPPSAQGPPDAACRRWVPWRTCDPARVDEVATALAGDPLAGGLLISDDGGHTALIVEFYPDPDRSAESVPKLVDDVFAAFEEAGFPRAQLSAGGLPISVRETTRQTQHNLERLMPQVLLALFVTVWLLFRALWPVLITMAVAGLGVLWTMGFSIALDPHVSILLSIVPAVVLVVSFSDVIHFLHAWRTELRDGRSPHEAVVRSATEVGSACLLTSATTFLGFIALALVPTPAFRKLGVVLGFGVGASLAIALVLTPVVLTFLPPPRDTERGARPSLLDRFVDAVVAGCERVATGRPRAVIAVFTVAVAVAVAGSMRLQLETDMEARLDDDNPTRRDMRALEANFAGTYAVELYVEAPAGRDLLDPAVLRAMQRAEHRAAAEVDGVEKVGSIVGLFERLHAALTGQQAAAGELPPLPETRSGVAEALLVFEMSGGRRLGQLIDTERRLTRTTARVDGGAMRRLRRIGDDVRAIYEAELGALASVEPTGIGYLLGDWLDDIIAGQQRGLAFSFVTVLLVMVWGLRSWRMGLWSMLPNAIPLIALGGLLGWRGEPVDSDMFAVGMLAIGIGVDDTIHVLVRYRRERARGLDQRAALRETFAFSGRAVVLTTVVLCIGFAPFASAGYLSVRIMGVYLPFALVVALLADLLFVPALVTAGLLDAPGGTASGEATPRPPAA